MEYPKSRLKLFLQSLRKGTKEKTKAEKPIGFGNAAGQIKLICKFLIHDDFSNGSELN